MTLDEIYATLLDTTSNEEYHKLITRLAESVQIKECVVNLTMHIALCNPLVATLIPKEVTSEHVQALKIFAAQMYLIGHYEATQELTKDLEKCSH